MSSDPAGAGDGAPAELPASVDDVYSFLGPSGTFTEAALKQVPEARGKHWRAVNNLGAASPR